MTPHQLARSGSESGHQKAFFAYCAVAQAAGFKVADDWLNCGQIDKDGEPIPCLKWLHHIPNGGLRDKRTAANMKAEGVRKGVADIFLPYPCRNKAGLYIEMKKPSLKPKRRGSGGLKPEQIQFREHCYNSYYEWKVCYSWQEAVNVLKEYLGYVS